MTEGPARPVAFTALAAFGLLHWMALVEPAEPARALAIAAAALLVLIRPALLALALPAALVAAGVQPRELWPGNWDELGPTLGAGVGLVGDVQLPYRGSDAAVRLAIGVGGALLALSAALVARRWRVPGLVLLGGLYGVPSIAVGFDAEFARGALLAVLMLAYLCAERLRVADLGPATGLAVGGAVLALAAAPALDGEEPWFDYEAFAEQRSESGTTRFDWEHDYAGLVWPREGREMLEIASPRRTYWKSETLDRFANGRWTRDSVAGAALGGQNDGVDPRNLERWSFGIEVSVRGLRSRTMPVAAVATAVRMKGVVPKLEAPGIWQAGRDLVRGDSYSARVYVPDPAAAELEAAGAPLAYPRPIVEHLSLEVPRDGRDDLGVLIRDFGARPVGDYFDPGYAEEQLRASPLGRTWALSRRLLAGAETPYEYLRNVRRHLDRGFLYDETPSEESATLDGFLFESRIGFCQHFSGAMALLLRMGGVPARVATGFAPGSYDQGSQRYVVRDVDAHSWVEAWFDGIGWVVFDPTPAAAPPRSQALPGAITAGVGDSRDLGTRQVAAAPVEEDDGRGPLLALVGLFVLAGAAGAWSRVPRRARGTELQRALNGAGWEVAPGTTLRTLARDLAPDAHGYLDALAAQRFAGGPGPSAADRAALRRALSSGRGPLTRARVWRALPPKSSPKA